MLLLLIHSLNIVPWIQVAILFGQSKQNEILIGNGNMVITSIKMYRPIRFEYW